MHIHSRRSLLFVWIGLISIWALGGQLAFAPQPPVFPKSHATRPRSASPSQNPAGSISAALPRLKAIFEPVSYSDDLQLFDVFFVNQNVGWAVGGKNRAGGVALYTSD